MSKRDITYFGSYRQRAFAMGQRWGLGKEVVRTFDTEVNAGVRTRCALVFATTAWDVVKPPGSMCADHIRFLHNAKYNTPRKGESHT